MSAFSSSGFSPLAFSVDAEPGPPSPTKRTPFEIVRRRKEVAQRVLLEDGTAVTVKVMDGLLIDDLLISGMKAEGYRVMTGRDVFPTVTRIIKDYLIKTGVIQE